MEFVLNQTTDLSGAATTAVFNRWQAQIERDEAAVLMNTRQHCEELDSEVKLQTGGGRARGRSPLGEAMTSPGSKELPDDDCRSHRRGVGHREHGGPFPLPPPEIMPIRAAYALARYLRRTLGRKRAQQRLIRESVIALNSISNSACRVLRDEPGSVSNSSASPLLPTCSQSSVFRRVRDKVISAGPPPVELSEQGALTELLHCQDLYALQPQNLVDYDLDKLRVTKGDVLPKDVVNLESTSFAEVLQHPGSSMHRSSFFSDTSREVCDLSDECLLQTSGIGHLSEIHLCGAGSDIRDRYYQFSNHRLADYFALRCKVKLATSGLPKSPIQRPMSSDLSNPTIKCDRSWRLCRWDGLASAQTHWSTQCASLALAVTWLASGARLFS